MEELNNIGIESCRYLLRRTLFPWKFAETINETIDYALAYEIDEVIWKIDTEELSHGLPTLDLIETYIDPLQESKKLLAEHGICMSINPWVTQGMRDAGWDLRTTFPDFNWLTDVSGIQAKSQACPLSDAWRHWLLSAYDRYASTGPRVLWLEDDIRIHGHRPVKFSCFCDQHIELFSKQVDKSFTRETLIAEILCPGKPSVIRKQWLHFVGSVIAEVIELIADHIYTKFPECQLGLMCSSPEAHAMECRDWKRVLVALKGHHEYATIRPCMGNYYEESIRGLYQSRQLVSAVLASTDGKVHACSEVENWPFSRYSKSVAFTQSQLLLSANTKCPAMTLNLYDHVGTPLFAEKQYGEMLQNIRPFLNAMVDAYRPEGVERGFGMLHNEDVSICKQLSDDATFGDLSIGQENFSQLIEVLGLSVTWERNPSVVAVTGQRFYSCENNLDDIFSKGVLMDLSALESILSMGREDLVGVSLKGTFNRAERETPVEQMINANFGGDNNAQMTVDHLGLLVRVGELELAGAQAISMLVNADREAVMPGTVIYENELGGRIVILPYDMTGEWWGWFLNWHRKRQFKAIANWLFRDQVPLSVDGGAYPLPIRTDYTDYSLVSVLNLSLDPWPTVDVCASFECPVADIYELDPRGQWQLVEPMSVCRKGNEIHLKIDKILGSLELMVFKFKL